MKRLSVVICTHNREKLLREALASLQAAERPQGWLVDILVAANACTDGTHALLENEAKRTTADSDAIPVRWFVEPRPGKALALNSAIPHLRDADLVAFVDDDQRVHRGYLVAACEAADAWPDFSLFCGRITPDWDGTEPDWVHTEGRYAIRPRPVPDSGARVAARELTPDDPTPGGGVLAVRGAVFGRVGQFSTELGPRGHDLGGSEDADFIERALASGERCRYVPAMLQYHHVDPERLRFGYVLRKAFARAKAEVIRRQVRTGIAPHQWKKLLIYALAAVMPPKSARFRFYLVRIASTLGEMVGQHANRWRPASRQTERRRNRRYLSSMTVAAATALGSGVLVDPSPLGQAALATMVAAASAAATLALWSWRVFTLAGPRLPHDIVNHYRTYAMLAYARLTFWAFLVAVVLAIPALVVQHAAAQWLGLNPAFQWQIVAACVGLALLATLQFLRQLLWLPASIAASYRYRLSRLYPFWFRLTPTRLRLALVVATGLPVGAALALTGRALAAGHVLSAIAYLSGLSFYALLALWLRSPEARPAAAARRSALPNVLLIGSDTLRADRLDGQHFRDAAPFLAELASRGVRFDRCFTPCARTAPSLLALLTGCWPARMNVADNFVPDDATRLRVPALPQIMRRHGYRTVALSDWCGGDLGKFDLGFERADVPEDQWNITLFLRQGPKDLRLFLSLFANNSFGRHFLPELFYLAGIPKTDWLGREARHVLTECAADGGPFFMNVFFSTTHGPFGSEYPYYTRYTSHAYRGESKFLMSRVTDPWDVIRRQAEPRSAFDLDQIVALYDGCVSRFDDEVKAICAHLEACGLADNTIVVLYSDHGMEFFEHDTWGQGNSVVSDTSNRIPMVFVGPGIAPRVVTEPVRATDLAPTLLDLCGLPIQEKALMDGRSLLPLMRGATLDAPLDVPTETGIWLTRLPGMHPNHRLYPPLTELLTVRDFNTGTISVRPEWERQVVHAKDRALRRGRWKLVCQPLDSGLLLQLFDVENDPDCRRDCATLHPGIVSDLWQRLRSLAADNLPDADRLPLQTGTVARA